MSKENEFNERLSSKFEIEFPDFTKLPDHKEAGFIQTFDLPVDPQKDGNWVKG